MHADEQPSPLEGIRVLDFSQALSGPYVGRTMADLGADVVKVESPTGDMTRRWGRQQAGMAGYFLQWNLGKRGLCVDLTTEGGVDLVKQLAQKADVVVENFRPHVMKKYGIDYEVLRELNPRLIMASITGFGADSPEAGRGAFAPVVHAETGLIARQAKASGGVFTDIESSVADTNTGLHTTVAILSALLLRSTTGKGQHLDMAMIDAQIATDDIGVYEIEDSMPTRPLGNRIWHLKEGKVLISRDARALWRLLAQEFNLVDNTPKDADLAEKIENRRRLMSEALRALPTKAAFVALMDKLRIPWGDVRESARLGSSAAISHRGIVTEMTDPAGLTRPVLKMPYRFSAATSKIRGFAPYLGEHNVEVCKEWLEMDEADIGTLQATGTLIQASR